MNDRPRRNGQAHRQPVPVDGDVALAEAVATGRAGGLFAARSRDNAASSARCIATHAAPSGTMKVVADTKDWTWVLERTCLECGFDTRTVAPERVGPLIGEVARAWIAVLASAPDAALRERPMEDRWSTLEYACHVRDVCKVMDGRLALILDTEDPEFPDWDQDAAATADRYGAQDPRRVATELSAAAGAIAERIATVRAGQWSRPGRRSDGARFSADSLMRYFLHDPIHHLYDVGAPWQHVAP